MTAYRYIVFAKGITPTRKEVDKFQTFYELLDRHVAYGINREDQGLAIACDAASFDRLIALDPEFEGLLIHWQVRGGKITERLPFSKNPGGWASLPSGDSVSCKPSKAKQAKSAKNSPDQVASSKPRFSAWMFGERLLAKKEANAQASIGLAMLETHRLISLGKKYQRLANLLPYLMWGVGVSAIAITGFYLSNRLTTNHTESRHQTIERITQNPMDESLTKQTFHAQAKC